MIVRPLLFAIAAFTASVGMADLASAQSATATTAAPAPSDAELVASLPGFRNADVTVNGVKLHYVIGGQGSPVVLLPGWPQTWWSWHKIMPELAKGHTVISLDIRGMGQSDKPADGYEKKTLANDVHELVKALGFQKADIIGHDIGSMVAFAYAANYPEATSKLIMLDIPHPDAELAKWPLLPTVGTFSDKIDENHGYPWWFAFHQVKGLPEDLLEGRQAIMQNWLFRYLMKDESKIDARDRAVYAAAYGDRDSIRASDGWYQAFPQDIIDDGSYAKLEMPVLALGGTGYGWLKATLERKTTNLTAIKIANSGHFIAEEQPEETLKLINQFLN
ncbi:alpha/beta hydrolase [Ochrobactrum soli]|uniref:alpha/beta fold hydrolase n=1 Tax=Hyphomicrobiales TaxID=356 RepID=UPI000EF1E4CC|nr:MULTISPECIES: alpha/beta hydrolase [Hyphomicrobiales]MCW8281549.1 alpha/beta hydrolase [Agrobacterium sp. InxBP2]RLL71566.1 alpha/beta hydrolase [[Ochrobactrum] soli]